MKKSKILLTTLCFALVLAVGGYFTLTHFNKTSNDAKITRTITTQIDYQSLLETFDDYNLQATEKSVSLEANKKVSLNWSELDKLSLDAEDENTTNVRYNYEFDLENNFIYMTITFTEFEEVVSIETFKGAAFYDESGNLDAVFNVEGEAVLMSEMANMNTLDQCGLFSKLVKAVKAVAVVVAVVAVVVVVATVVVATAGAGAVAVAGVGAVVGTVGAVAVPTVAVTAALIAAVAVGVYLLADAIAVTADFLTHLEKSTESNKVYFPTFITVGLSIIPVPVSIDTAKIGLLAGQNFWTPAGTDAEKLCLAANNTAFGPDIDYVKGTTTPKTGYYWHYHCYATVISNHIGGHSYFGAPYGGAYLK